MQSKAGAPRGLDLLWGADPRGARGPRARYTISDVAEAAIRVADERGLDAVTLGATAKSLGLATTALYSYVDAKDDLLEVMVDAAVGEPPPLTGDTWQDRARSWARALAGRYRAHGWLMRIQAVGTPRRPSVYAWLEAMVLALEGEEIDAVRLALILDAVVRGLSSQGADPAPPPFWLGDSVRAHYPRLAAELTRDWSDSAGELERALDVVLAGAQAAL